MREPNTPTIPAVVKTFARLLGEALSDRLVGVYLGGSFVMGDFVDGVSDFDLLVVLDGPLSKTDLATLARLHEGLVAADPEAARLEGDYVPRGWLTAEGTIHPVPYFRRGRLQPEPAFMLSADNIANLGEQGLAVLGSPASAVLPAVTADQVRAAVRLMLADVPSCSTEAQAADELIDLLRSMRALETGAPTTKSDGVRWGLAHLEPRWHTLVRRADAVRRGAPAELGDVLRQGLSEIRVELDVGGEGTRDASWRVLERRTLIDRSPWYRIEEQRLELPDGRVVDRFPRMELRDYSIVVALTPANELLTQRAYKHGIGRVTLDLVAGLIEDGEDPLHAARRELLEETGYQSDQWSALGSYVVNSNYGCGRMHAFIARDAVRVTEPNSGDLEDLELILRPLADAVDDLRAGRFELLSAAAALALACVHLKR